MFVKVFVLVSSVVYGSAHPVWFNAPTPPSIAFGFGSGFSSDIGGIKHSNSFGTAYSSGDASAYGAGLANSGEAQGIGIAQTGPTSYQPTYYIFDGNRYDSSHGQNNQYSISLAQNNPGSSISAVQNTSPGQYQSALAFGQKGFGSAASSSNILGYGSALSAQNGYQSAVSAVQGYGGHGSAVAAAQNYGGHQLSFAQASQQRRGGFSSSGASSLSSPGYQYVQSNAVNSGFY